MSTLHTVNKSPFTHNALTSCLRIARSGDSLLLLEDGVYAASGGNHQHARQLQAAIGTGIRVHVLSPDAQARQITLAENLDVVDYAGFVKLTTHHQRIQSWHA